jgi:chromosomal replication initiation ATPase DnaA
MSPSYYVFPGLEPNALAFIMIPKPNRRTTIPEVVSMVCEHCRIPEDAMYSRFKGVQHIYDTRKIICYICNVVLKRSLMDIARELHRNHTSILSAVRKTKDLMQTEEQFAKQVYALSQKVIQ